MSDTPQQPIAGRYRLIRPLGQGGMGRVWLAHDDLLLREVAIKELVPAPGLSEAEQRDLRERSLREARTIARLDHVNVVRIFDVLHDGGEPWIVMELILSRPLDRVLREDGPMAPDRVARLGLSLVAALRTAHQAGVLHRDVKPANVLIAHDGRVVLTDFGLATAPDDPGLTRTGVVLGSPAYLAPERVLDLPFGPASDLWSLGATLYSAVEGRSPYARSSAIATLAALTTELPAPPERAGVLLPVLDGLLRREPAERIGLDEAERLLRQMTGEEPGIPAPPARDYASSSWSSNSLASQGSAGSQSSAASLGGGAGPAGGGCAGSVGAAGARGRSRRALVVALAGAAVLALGAGVLLANSGLFGAEADAARSPVPAAGSAGPSAGPSAGWHFYRDSPGFSVPVPDGWLPVRDGRHVEFREPGGTRVLSVDEIDPPAGSLLSDARSRAKAAIGSGDYPKYKRIGIGEVSYHVRAVEHEWTYAGATAMHAVSRAFVSESGRAYLIGWRTSEAVWEANQPALALVFDGFRAGQAEPTLPAAASVRPSKSTGAAPKPTKTRASSAPTTAAPVGRQLKNMATGTCIDVPNSNPDGGAEIQMWPCNDTAGQRFTMPADATIRTLGKCLQIDGTTDGSTLQLATCTGGGTQRFTLNAAFDLVNLQVDKCVEVPDSDASGGVVIRITTCTGPGNQKWSLE